MTAAHQAYLLQARQMQALSFAVHIPLVCFGIAFPAMVLFAECCTCAPATSSTARSRGAGRGSWPRCLPSA